MRRLKLTARQEARTSCQLERASERNELYLPLLYLPRSLARSLGLHFASGLIGEVAADRRRRRTEGERNRYIDQKGGKSIEVSWHAERGEEDLDSIFVEEQQASGRSLLSRRWRSPSGRCSSPPSSCSTPSASYTNRDSSPKVLRIRGDLFRLRGFAHNCAICLYHQSAHAHLYCRRKDTKSLTPLRL